MVTALVTIYSIAVSIVMFAQFIAYSRYAASSGRYSAGFESARPDLLPSPSTIAP